MSEEIPVVKVLIRQNGKFLVVRDRETGKWELPGGRIEKNEDRFQAAERELEEEVCLQVSNLEDVVRIELEDERTVNCYLLYAENFRGDEEPQDDVTETRWVTAEEFRDMDWRRDAGYNIPALEYLDEYLRKEKGYGGVQK